MRQKKPVVLTISGHDPSGGAGIQADIETLAALDCHACSVITALTDQDTRNVIHVFIRRNTGILNQLTTEAISEIVSRFADAMLKMGADFNKDRIMNDLKAYFG